MSAVEEIVNKVREEVEEYKGHVVKVAEELASLKTKLANAVDTESWKQVASVVAELDETNAKLGALVESAPAVVVEDLPKE